MISETANEKAIQNLDFSAVSGLFQLISSLLLWPQELVDATSIYFL